MTGDSAANDLSGGAGNDVLSGGAGADTLDGGTGTDTLDYSSDASASNISVTLDSSVPATVTVTGADDDSIQNIENVTGTGGNDTIIGDSLANVINGQAGDDTLQGGQGADMLFGGDGNDIVTGGEDNDVLMGGNGADILQGGEGGDLIFGGAGDDTLVGGDGNNSLTGGDDIDTVDYSASATAVTAGFIEGSSGTVTRGSDVDTIEGIENFILTGEDDTISFDMEALAAGVTLDAADGSDTVSIANSADGENLSDNGIEGITLAALFSDVETIDFTNTDLNAGDNFEIGNNDISDVANDSSLIINLGSSGIELAQISVFSQDSASIDNDTTTGSIRTVDWSDGVQLIVNA